MTARVPDIAQVRLDNALLLFDEFVALATRTPDPALLRGLEGRFAEQLGIQPSYWSQLKSRSRQIGERLARQFEQLSGKPYGWMDIPHSPFKLNTVMSSWGLSPDIFQKEPYTQNSISPSDSLPSNDDERFITSLVLSYYRRHPEQARARLLTLLTEALGPASTPPETKPAKPAPDEGTDDHSLWLKSQRGVAPLKRKR
jgi:hypothetical protein